MKIGINATGVANLDQLVDTARRTEQAGFASLWIAQIFGLDALTALAVVGREVDRIELGTAVVPTFPRHPMVLAGQALTVQAATADRLTLGIGLSHQIVVEHMWGLSYERPVRHMREYLDALLPLLRGEAVEVRGETITSVGKLDDTDAAAPGVVVAALGTQMLKVTGARGCGTITWCTGERGLLDHVVPRITEAAAAAGQPAPRVVAGLPICVTPDPEAARAFIAEQLVVYGGLPSYRAMLDLDDAAGPEDVAVVGDEDAVVAALARLAAGGVTDFAASILARTAEERDRTWELLRTV